MDELHQAWEENTALRAKVAELEANYKEDMEQAFGQHNRLMEEVKELESKLAAKVGHNVELSGSPHLDTVKEILNMETTQNTGNEACKYSCGDFCLVESLQQKVTELEETLSEKRGLEEYVLKLEAQLAAYQKQEAEAMGQAAIRPKFEKWYMAEMCTSALFERWMDTDYYEDSHTQSAWRGYQAAVADMAANVELSGN
jgi:cell division septum initiation protein DivIVA